ncbi:hypothetical protein KJ841_01635 [Patescibacteria group bacterium]|nr:hypothetical protein [Patescibacteria group bacterium]
MKKIIWANLLHLYQPPDQKKHIIRKVVKESYRPLLKTLKKNPKVKITLNIPACLTQILAKNKEFSNIIKDIKKLSAAGQIEFTGSAAFHAFLPLIHTGEIRRQIQLNERINKEIFGNLYQPKGFFPPEMGYNEKMAKVVKRMGYQWLVLDEIALNKKLGKISFRHKYFNKKLGINFIFRNRALSDIFSYTEINTLEDFIQTVNQQLKNNQPMITAFNGINKLFTEIVNSNEFKTVTYSELLNSYKKSKEVTPRACSWASTKKELRNYNPYSLWYNPKNEIHQLQWQLFKLVVNTVRRNLSSPDYLKARGLLDRSLNSDIFWWASANPWWDVKFVEDATNKMLNIIKIIRSPKDKSFKQVLKYNKKIIALLKEWQKTGKVQRIKEKYLKSAKKRIFFGGEQIFNNKN